MYSDSIPHHRDSKYVVSEDIKLLLSKWCKDMGFKLPDDVFFEAMRNRMRSKLQDIFSEYEVVFVSEKEITEPLSHLLENANAPIVSLDKIYTNQALSLDYTRLVNHQSEYLGLSSRTQKSISKQLDEIDSKLSDSRSIELVDDVIFSGDGIIDVISWFNQRGIKVERVIAGISIGNSSKKIISTCNLTNPSLIVESALHFEDVLDEICERDFYPGVPLSGRLIGTKNGENLMPIVPEIGASYILPYGNPSKWASIPQDRVKDWSYFCLEQTRTLWYIIEKLSSQQILCKDLPRRPPFFHDDLPVLECFDQMIASI